MSSTPQGEPESGAPKGSHDPQDPQGQAQGQAQGEQGSRDPQDARDAGDSSREDNPFAPPPEGSPDQPWQPRHPENGARGGDGGAGDSRRGRGRWSNRQPGRSPGGFGQKPGAQDGPGGSGGPGGSRWDPTDPTQRRARYALLAGMWAFFFALFSWPYVALLLGALAVHWGIAALRAKPDPTKPSTSATATAEPSTPTTPATPPKAPGRPQTTAAVAGLVTAGLALSIVAATFTAQIVYRDYYTCVNDALTNAAKDSCESLLPEELRPLLGEQD
nr:hypothetical protein [Streptomyces apocyni]